MGKFSIATVALALSTAFGAMTAQAQDAAPAAPDLEDYTTVTFGGDLSGGDAYSEWWAGVSAYAHRNCAMYGMMSVQPFQAPYDGDDTMKGYDWFVIGGEKGCQTGTGFQGSEAAIKAKAAELNEERRQKNKRLQQGMIAPQQAEPTNPVVGPGGIIPNP